MDAFLPKIPIGTMVNSVYTFGDSTDSPWAQQVTQKSPFDF